MWVMIVLTAFTSSSCCGVMTYVRASIKSGWFVHPTGPKVVVKLPNQIEPAYQFDTKIMQLDNVSLQGPLKPFFLDPLIIPIIKRSEWHQACYNSWNMKTKGKQWGIYQYVVFAHWMLCCPVGYVERRGPYLPWQA